MADIPAEQIRAAIRLLYPEEMTPHAKRVLESICEQSERSSSDQTGEPSRYDLE